MLTLYHVTSVEIAEKIKAEGFKPIDQGFWRNYYAPQGRDGIYFYDDLKYSEAYASVAEGKFWKKLTDSGKPWSEIKNRKPEMAIIKVRVPEDAVQTTEHKEDGFFVPNDKLNEVQIEGMWKYEYIPTAGRQLTEKFAFDYDDQGYEYASPGKYIYHVTYLKNLDSIASGGLTPGAESGIGGPALAGHKAGKVFLTDAKGVSFWVMRAEEFAYHNSDEPGEEGLIPCVLRMREQADWKLKLDDIGTDDSGSEAFYYNGTLMPDDIEVWNGSSWVSIYSANIDPMSQVDEEGYIQEGLQKPKLAYADQYDMVPQHGFEGIGGQAFPKLRRTQLWWEEPMDEGTLKHASVNSESELAPEPGTAPIPPGTVRLYHYTKSYANLASIRSQGLLASKARGDDGSGRPQPSAGVWASSYPPEHNNIFVEFWAKPDQISQRANYPDKGWRQDPNSNRMIHDVEPTQEELDEWAKGYRHVIMNGDVPPSQFIAIHEPWHYFARYIVENWDEMYPQQKTQEEVQKLESFGAKDEAKALSWAIKHFSGKTGSRKVAFDSELYSDLEFQILNEYNDHLGDKEYRMKWELVPAGRLIKIWNDWAKTGHVRDEKGLDDIAWLITKNIYKLQINTFFTGHETGNPRAYAQDMLDAQLPEDYWEQVPSFFDDEKGNWRISDYAMKPLWGLADQLEKAQSPEQKLQIIDKILNVVHQRSDLASWFVEGGSRTLSRLSGQGKTSAARFAPFNTWLRRQGGMKGLLGAYDVQLEEQYGYDLDIKNQRQREQEMIRRARDEYEDKYNELVASYNRWVFPMDVYRCISVPEVGSKTRGREYPAPAQQHLFPGTPMEEYQQGLQSIQYKGVGVYWSWDENAAECHWGTGGPSVTLHAVITENDVDWEGTLSANMMPSTGDEEKEVRLKEGTQFELEGIQYEGDNWIEPPVKMVTAKVANEPRVFYHATAAKNINSIAKNGLKPSQNPQWGGSLGQFSYDKTFFAPTPGGAMYYAEIVFRDTLEAYGKASIPICLRVTIPPEMAMETGEPEIYNVHELKEKEEFREAWVKEVIPPSRIEMYWHDQWQPIKAGSWSDMEVVLSEEEGYVDWEGGPIGYSLDEVEKDVESYTMPKTAKMNEPGQVYLLHFLIGQGQTVPSSRPDATTGKFHAGHYLGWAKDAQTRIQEHYNNTSGVKLIEALHGKGLTFTVAKIWGAPPEKPVTRAFERRLKNQGGLSRSCPICKQLGIDRDTVYKKKKLQDVQVAPAQPTEGPDFVEQEKVEKKPS